MIVSSAPLRISLVGGGSDLPSFTDHSIGRVVSATIDKRVYITLSHSFRICTESHTASWKL